MVVKRWNRNNDTFFDNKNKDEIGDTEWKPGFPCWGRHHQSYPSQCMVGASTRHHSHATRAWRKEEQSIFARRPLLMWTEWFFVDHQRVMFIRYENPPGSFFNGLRRGTSPVLIWANHIKSSCLSTINIYKLGKSSCLSTINGFFHGSNIVCYPLLFKNGASAGKSL